MEMFEIIEVGSEEFIEEVMEICADIDNFRG